MDLFDRVTQAETRETAPLADRMRPRTLAELVGQHALLDPGTLLRKAIEQDRVPSLILWGPPGTGKTTLAQVIAHESKARFTTLSAVLSGVPDLRAAVAEAREHKRVSNRRTILFVDEIHRFNKAQQDALLPHVEQGVVTLIGATTENPSFAVNGALLSRARVFRLEALSEAELVSLLERALSDSERGLGAMQLTAEPGTLQRLAAASDGDARRALTLLEALAHHAKANGSTKLGEQELAQLGGARSLLHDKTGEAHYNVVSAFIKSMRGSDPDAAVYWMMRMLEAGEDPRFVLRRLLIFASEDIGNADPRALSIAVAADQAFARLGMPEGLHTLSQCCTYLACAPKSNASYMAFSEAKADIEQHGSLDVPMKLRNASTKAMASWGYGQGYRYPHDEGGYSSGETYLPDALVGRRYYRPSESGEEAAIKERLRKLRGS
ncbi:MAG TPA: replication-associated recombination protein A [Polyangiales bacterium]|nr:replication-associated recombination protein A [Polyangiales bacterium]